MPSINKQRGHLFLGLAGIAALCAIATAASIQPSTPAQRTCFNPTAETSQQPTARAADEVHCTSVPLYDVRQPQISI